MTVPKSLTQEERALLRAEHGDGHLRFEQCALCGALRWVSRAPGLPNEITVASVDPAEMDCARCLDVFRRNPELARWVLAVVSHHERADASAQRTEAAEQE